MQASRGLSPLAEEALNTARSKRSRMPAHPWSAEDEKKLKAMYPDHPATSIAAEMGRTYANVLAKARRMGLRKSPEFLASDLAKRLTGGQGKATRFQKGHKPWNTGVKGLNFGDGATRFKPGVKPHTWLPVGSERVRSDGYLQRKMTDTGYPPRDWVCVHTLLWIEHNGPIPDKHLVVFRDGNKTNLSIENLELVTRKEMMKRNTIQRFPPELKATIRTMGKLKRLIQEQQHEEQN